MVNIPIPGEKERQIEGRVLADDEVLVAGDVIYYTGNYGEYTVKSPEEAGPFDGKYVGDTVGSMRARFFIIRAIARPDWLDFIMSEDSILTKSDERGSW